MFGINACASCMAGPLTAPVLEGVLVGVGATGAAVDWHTGVT